MSRSRIEIVVVLIVIAVGGLVAAIVGLFAYMSLTATPLHPDAQKVSSVTRSDPSSTWTGAVEQAIHVLRKALGTK